MAFTPGAGAVISFTVQGTDTGQRQIKLLASAIDGAGGSAKTALKELAAFAGVGLSFTAMAHQVLDAQREFDKLNASLITATGSTAKAKEAFAALQAFASTTPYSVQEATEAFIKMRNLGLDPSEKALRSYGNTAAAMSKGLDQMIEAVADASTGEFERLKEFGITAKQNGDRVALTFKGMTAMIGNNAKDIQAYLRNLGEVDFAGGMELRASTLDGAISNLGDTWQSTMRSISSNGIGEATMSGVLALSGALQDLSAILDAVGGAASKEGKSVKEAGILHLSLTTIFETVAVLGTNVAYVFEQMGLEIGGLAAQASLVLHGDFKGAAAVGQQMKKDAADARAAVDAKSAAILGASAKAQAAQDAETANMKKNGTDRLAQYQIELSSEEKRTNALNALLDVRKRLLGIDPQDQADMKKIQVAFDTGAISLGEYTRLKSLLDKQTRMNSQAYKDEQKNIDASTESIKQRIAAQGLLNQREKEHIDFLKSSGQIDDSEAIRQTAAVDTRELSDQKKALEDQLALAKRKIDNQKEQITLSGQIGEINTKISNRQKKEEEDLFLIEQQRYRLAVNNYADLLEAAQAESKSQQDQVRDQQDYIDQLGMTQKQVAGLTASRLRDQAARLDEKADLFELIDASGRLSAEYRKQAEALRSRAVGTAYAEQLKEEQQFWGDVERVAHDTFVSIADGGKSAFTRLKESAKNIFFEWLYQMTLKKWVINIGASMGGPMSVAGLQSGTSMLTQGGSIMGTASNLYSAITGGFSALSTGVADAVQAGLYASGLSSNIASNGSFASGAGWAAGAVGGYMTGSALNSAISGGYETGSGVMKVEKIATAVASAFGPEVGAIVGAISGLVNRAFGMGATEVQSAGMRGTLSASSLTGKDYQNLHQDGGWFRSDKNWVKEADFSAEVVKQFTQGLAGVEAASAGFAAALGVQADWIKDYSKAFDIKMTGDAQKDAQAIADLFTGIGDEIAEKLVPNLDEFSKSGESASATLQRLAADFQGTMQVAQLLGMSAEQLFGSAGMDSASARERLIAAAGSLQVLAQGAQAFSQNFLTDAERLAPVAAALDKALAGLGLHTIPTTRDEFKALAQDLIASGASQTDQGAKQLASLLALSEVFAQVHPQIDAVAEATERAAAALQSVKDQASMLLAGVDDAYSVLQKVVSREKSAIQLSVDTHTAAFNKLQSLSQALHSTLDSLQSPNQKAFERTAAQAQIRAALAIAKAGGSLPDSDALKNALSAVTQDASSQFSNYVDYVRDLAQTKSDIAQLAGITDDSLSVEQRALDALKDQLTRLDDIVANGQAQLDALNGQSIATLSLAQAMTALQSSIAAAQTNPIVAGTSSVASLYQELLGRAPDQAGLKYWQDVLASGASLENIRNVFMGSDEYKKLHPFAVGTNFVPETMPALVHQGERIIPAADNRVLMSVLARASSGGGDNAALVAEIKALRAEVAELRKVSAETAKNTGEHKDMFEYATAGGRAPMQVEIAK